MCAKTTVVVGLACVVAVSVVVTFLRPRVSEQAAFERAAREAIETIASGDIYRFSRVVAKEVVVARRRIDWERSTEIRKPKPSKRWQEHWVGLPLAGLDQGAVVWEESELMFGSHEVGEQAFRRLLTGFRSVIRSTMHYPRDLAVSYSLNGEDFTGSRRIGPSAEGKLASDTFWYVYFVREKGKWRVYRLEVLSN